MNRHYDEEIDNKRNEFHLPPHEEKFHHRIERAEQVARVIPVIAIDMAAFQPVVHAETTPHVVTSEKKPGPSHRLGEKPKLIPSLIDAAKRSF